MFTKICLENSINEDQSMGFTHDGFEFFIIKKDGKIHAYKNSCPHLGIPLEMIPNQFLDDEAALIQCSTHGALFMIDSGLCVAGPCHDQSLKKLDVRVVDEHIEVDLSEA